MPARSSTSQRNEYTDQEDTFLVQYIAKYNPQPEGRTGNKLYERLVENAERKWPWHKRHTWQSWRERYRTNKDYFDRRIAKQLRDAATEAKSKSRGSAASASPAPAPPAPTQAPAPQSPPSDKRERVQYTMEDDDNLAEYLAANSLSNRGRQGKNLYEAIADEPWGARHPWQSWHERYRKNQAYFDARIRRIHAGEDGSEAEDEDEDVPRPRTVDGAIRYSLSQSRVHAKREKEREKEREQAKRRRESRGDGAGEAPPKKKARVEEPVAGPSRRREPELEPEVVEVPEEPEAAEEPEVEMLDEPDVGGAHQGREAEGPPGEEEKEAVAHAEEQAAVEQDEEQDEEVDDGGEEQGMEDEDELEDEDEDEDDQDEDEQGPIGSDDYSGEIFDVPEPDEEIEGEDGSESESDRDQEEAELMLSDNPFANAQDMDEALLGDVDADADVDMGGDETVVEAGAIQLQTQDEDHQEENPFDASPHDIPMADDDDSSPNEPHISTTPPSGASPPARTHNTRIEHDIDARPDTPELSPAEEADARHRREHGHEPAPARKHATRIRTLRKRGRGEDDFFATPTPATSAQNSPTARHVARREVEGQDGGGGGGDGPQKRERQREPPRLDEGAWNTAFSDARGRMRESPKRPRRSGVEPDFEAEDAEAGEASERGGMGEVGASPAQWPPVRGRAKGKAKVKEEAAAPTTPARGTRDKGKAREVAASPGEGRVVTTEHILSVKTIRTVERRLANGVGGAGAIVEAAHKVAADQPSSPRTLVQEDEDEERREEVKAEERHPFSQVEPRESRGASSSRGSSVFPRAGGGVKDSRKDDIARMQKMLAASRRAMPPEEKDKDKDNEKDKKRRTRLGGLWRDESPESFLRRLSTGGAPGKASELGSRTTRGMSPLRTAEDARLRGQRLARFQEREESLPVPESVPPLASSPLARRGSNSTVGEIVPHASTSRVAQGVPKTGPLQRAGKGKARAGATPSGAINGYGQSRPHTTNEPPEAGLNPAPREQSTIVRRPRHAPRPSLPAIPSFPLGVDDSYTALSHIFHPPPSGAGHARVYTLPSRPSLPSLLPSHPSSSADPPMYASLPAHERAMVKAAGMQCMLAAMARNHGFGMEVVNEVCAEAGSLEKTDRVLRDMRESANRQANVSLREMYSRSDDGAGGEQDEDGEEEDEEDGFGEDGAEGEEHQDEEEHEDAEEAEETEDEVEAEEGVPAEDADDVDEDLPDSSAEVDDGDSAEVESVLGQDANSWLDDAPQAESSRIRGGAAEYGEDGMDIDVDVSRVTSTSTSLRKPFRIKLLPKEPAPGVVYSPPKKTRASRFIKKAQKAELELARSPQRGQEAMEVDADADPFANMEIPMKPRYASLPAGNIGQLSKYGAEEWLNVERKYGPGAAKMMMGKALAKLLPARPQ